MPDIYVASKKKKKKRTPKVKPLIKSLARMGLRPTINPLAAFIALPKKINFDTQRKKEKIILLLRRHWITNVPWFSLVCLMIFTPFLLTVFPLLTSFPARFRSILVIMWYLFILSLVLEKFLSWFFNICIITDERVIDVDFISLVYREISQVKKKFAKNFF